MYRFYYTYIHPRYVENGFKVQLLMTDTDSLCLFITQPDPSKEFDVYEDMADEQGLHWFDRSNFDPTSRFFDESKKKALGMFKDEMDGKPARMFVGLRAKMYALAGDGPDPDIKSSAKGMPKSVKKTLGFDDWQKAQLGIYNKGSMVEYHSIRGQDHVLSTVKIAKVGLSRFDDKTYLGWDEQSFKFGHWRINEDGEQRAADQQQGENAEFVESFLGGKTIDEARDNDSEPEPEEEPEEN